MSDQDHLQKPPSKWRAELRADLKGARAAQIWPLVSDFFALHRWLPHLDTCKPLNEASAAAAAGEPGLVRYCATTRRAAEPSDAGERVDWATERLTAIDHKERRLSYEIVENNIGFGEYAATMRVVHGGDEGCAIEWSYVADPIVGWAAEDLFSFVESALKAMAVRMEEAVAQPQASEG